LIVFLIQWCHSLQLAGTIHSSFQLLIAFFTLKFEAFPLIDSQNFKKELHFSVGFGNMAVSLKPFSSWNMWGGGGRRKEKEPVSNGSSLNSSTTSEWTLALKEREAVKFPLVKENKKVQSPSHRKVRRKREEKMEETRIDREYDVVFVPSDGGDWCLLSGSESDDSDWSIGWLEPLGSDFESNDNDDEDDSGDHSFAVLVPCYSPGCKEVEGSNNVLLNAIKNLPNEFSSGMTFYNEFFCFGFLIDWFCSDEDAYIISSLLLELLIFSFEFNELVI
jgi:hypothetical protein